MSNITYHPMTMADYDATLALWQSSEGVGLSDADERAAIERYLTRNPGLSWVAYYDVQLIGAILCGHDGRRGFLHHLAVAEPFRHQGIGKTLAQKALSGLDAEGIEKCHLFVYKQNRAGQAFWNANGWLERSDLIILSTDI